MVVEQLVWVLVQGQVLVRVLVQVLVQVWGG
jgi:hypothetical protein